MRTTLKSISRTDVVYVYDTEMNYTRNRAISDYMRKYETYGDGTIAHTPDYAIGSDDCVDYLRSLAVAMMENHELAKYVAWEFSTPSPASMKFAATIKYKEGKKQYFSLSESKISARESLQHDKRYTEVTPGHDGTPEAIAEMLVEDYFTFFRRYVYRMAVREWYAAEFNSYMNMPHVPGKPESDGMRESVDCAAAYRACQSIIQAIALLDYADTVIGNWTRQQEAESAAALS